MKCEKMWEIFRMKIIWAQTPIHSYIVIIAFITQILNNRINDSLIHSLSLKKKVSNLTNILWKPFIIIYSFLNFLCLLLEHDHDHSMINWPSLFYITQKISRVRFKSEINGFWCKTKNWWDYVGSTLASLYKNGFRNMAR